MKVKIPFMEQFREPMLAGIKTCTSRTKKYGEEGDTFEVFGAMFEIQSVCRFPLRAVASELYKYEGFNQPEEFIDIWTSLHPRKGYDPEQRVNVHFFRREIIEKEED